MDCRWPQHGRLGYSGRRGQSCFLTSISKRFGALFDRRQNGTGWRHLPRSIIREYRSEQFKVTQSDLARRITDDTCPVLFIRRERRKGKKRHRNVVGAFMRAEVSVVLAAALLDSRDQHLAIDYKFLDIERINNVLHIAAITLNAHVRTWDETETWRFSIGSLCITCKLSKVCHSRGCVGLEVLTLPLVFVRVL
jgi:hypothetical protein